MVRDLACRGAGAGGVGSKLWLAGFPHVPPLAWVLTPGPTRPLMAQLASYCAPPPRTAPRTALMVM